MVWEPSEGGAAPPSLFAVTLRHSQRMGPRRCWIVTRTEASWVPEPLTTLHTYSQSPLASSGAAAAWSHAPGRPGGFRSCTWGSQFSLPFPGLPTQPDRS